MEEKQKAAKYLAEEFGVSELVALDHARGSIPQAKALLARQLFGREVREYGLES